MTGSVLASTPEQLVDTDGDGISDMVENRHGLDASNPFDGWRDTDGDHLPLVHELSEGLDSNSVDNNVFNDQRLLAIQAIVDIQGHFASEKQIKHLLYLLNHKHYSPVDIYQWLLDETYFGRMGFVGRVYQAVLLRSPDLDGARYYHHQLGGALSKQQMVAQFVDSAEFQRRYGRLSNKAFINLLGQNVFGSPLAPDETEGYLEGLNKQTLSRSELMLAFIDSQVYIKAYDLKNRVDVLGLLLTGALPDSEHSQRYQRWLNRQGDSLGHRSSDSSGDSSDILKVMLASEGYRQSRVAQMGSANDDTDGDGRLDGVEFANGTDVNVKDHDVLGSDHLFVRQMLQDFKGRLLSEREIAAQVKAIEQGDGRLVWVKQLTEYLSGHLSNYPINGDAGQMALLFNGLYRRDATDLELTDWLNRLDDGTDMVDLIEMMVNSAEYQARFY